MPEEIWGPDIDLRTSMEKFLSEALVPPTLPNTPGKPATEKKLCFIIWHSLAVFGMQIKLGALEHKASVNSVKHLMTVGCETFSLPLTLF